jgi:CHAT domain-containing protein
LTERARSRHLVELMASNDLYKEGDIPPEVQRYLDEYETLQRRIDQLRQQEGDSAPDSSLASSTLRSDRRLDSTPEQSTARNQQIKQLLSQKQDIWKQLRSLDRVLADGLEVPSLSLDQLQQLIENQPRTALLSQYTTQDQTYILILRHTANDITGQLHTCTDQGIPFQNWILQNWLTPYQREFSTWVNSMPERLAELSARLQLNTLVRDHLQGIDELIILPHLALHLIPFAALPLSPDALTPSPSPNNGRGEPEVTYLGDRFRLRILPSAQILSYCQKRENGKAIAPNVPGVSMGSVEDASGDRPVVTAGFEAIAQRMQIPVDQRLRGKQQATTANYRTLSQRDSIQTLHSIHHAASNLGSPLESALQLADGNITLGQLLSPGWRMPHLVDVFLSCCETNLGTPNLTDDLLTLSTGFLCAGARSVVSTLWSVDALATALFCDFYYEFRDAGSDRPTALQEAQQAMRSLTLQQLSSHLEQTLDRLEDNIYELRRQTSRDQRAGHDITAQLSHLAELKRQADRLHQIQSELPHQYPQDHPFASPYFWAGFISQGLR